MQIDQKVAHWRKAALRLSAPKDSQDKNVGILGKGPFAAKPNTEYVLTFWVKGEQLATKGGSIRITNQTVPHIPSGGFDWSKGTYHSASIPAGTYDWCQVAFRFKTDEKQDAIWAQIVFDEASGTLWLDDIRLMTAAASATAPQISVSLETEFGRQRFVPGEKIPLFAYLRNNRPKPLAVKVAVSLQDGEKSLANAEWSGELQEGVTQRVPLFTWDSARHRCGDYRVRGVVSHTDQSTIPLRLVLKLDKAPKQDFFWGMFTVDYPAEDGNRPTFEKLKQYGLSPTYSSLFPEALDLALEYGLCFAAQIIIPAHFAERKNAKGETWKHGLGTFGLSDPASWEEAGKLMEEQVRLAARYPTFYGWLITSDDFSSASGWDWAESNRRRFKARTQLDPPVPPVFAQGTPRIEEVNRELSKRPPGIVPEKDPWLLWCRFLSRDVLGSYNQALQKGAERGMRGVRVGPVPGGQHWPLFQIASGQYPPYNFGSSSFHLLSFYYYLSYWQPSISYIYWSEIARMGNRDYPVLCVADSRSPMRHYTRNNFYLLLAGGVQGISYFTFPETHPQFWEEAPALAAVVRENGPLLAQLKPSRRPVGFLLPFTTSAFNPTHPVYNLYAYANLLHAHIDAEPICEEEILSRDLNRYDSVVLSDIRWLTPSVVKKLQDFIRRGKVVYIDSTTAVPIEGAKRLAFPLGESSITAYGDAARIAKVRATMVRRHLPWADSDDPWLILRSFEAKGARYCWAVNVENSKEFKMFRRFTLGWPNEPNEPKLTEEEWTAYEKKQDLVNGAYSSSVSFPAAAGAAVYDVLSGKMLIVKRTAQRRTYSLTMPRFGGKLLMLLPRPIARLTFSGPDRIKRGASSALEVRLLDDQGKLVPGAVPIAIRISRGNGQAEIRHEIASAGTYRLQLDVPVNESPGRWKITVSTRFLTGPGQVVFATVE
ncbi:MAG: hypothetical protein ACYC3I_25545 [Gemmataceae bacterium]